MSRNLDVMDDVDVLRRAHLILNKHGPGWEEPITVFNFAKFREYTADTIKYVMSSEDRARMPWLPQWAEYFRQFGDKFDDLVKADPLLTYRPRTQKHSLFHFSPAYIRYLMAANGVGKTLLAYVEDIWCATGQKHWRGRRGNVAVVSTGHTVYSEKVFLTKMLRGEDGDPFSPYLPEGGKWLHSFDERKYILRIACRPCANAGLTKKCTHLKTIHCLTADSGVERLMGFTARLFHIDEHVPKEIFSELHQRVRRGGADGRGILTATPLAGPDSWEIQDLYKLATEYPERNFLDAIKKDIPYVEIFNISKYDCVGTPNGPTLGEIEQERLTRPDSEFKARVLGEPVPISDSPVFDIGNLDKMEKEQSRAPVYCNLQIKAVVNTSSMIATTVERLDKVSDVEVVETQIKKSSDFSGMRIWQLPQHGAQYAIGVDTALGTGHTSEKGIGNTSARRDASCAQVFRIIGTPGGGIQLEQVAEWWGYYDIYEYAKQVKMLGWFYNKAVLVPETTGIGGATTTALARQLNYPSIYIGENDGRNLDSDIETKYGVHTNIETKPKIVAAAHSYLKENALILRDKETISEFRSFQQVQTPSGGYKYEAAPGAHDDRVMAAALVCYAARHSPVILLSLSVPPAILDGDRVQKYDASRVSQKVRKRNMIKYRYI